MALQKIPQCEFAYLAVPLYNFDLLKGWKSILQVGLDLLQRVLFEMYGAVKLDSFQPRCLQAIQEGSRQATRHYPQLEYTQLCKPEVDIPNISYRNLLSKCIGLEACDDLPGEFGSLLSVSA